MHAFFRLKSGRRSASRVSTGKREATCTRRPTTESKRRWYWLYLLNIYRSGLKSKKVRFLSIFDHFSQFYGISLFLDVLASLRAMHYMATTCPKALILFHNGYLVMIVILWWNLSKDESYLVMKVIIVKEGDVSPVAMFFWDTMLKVMWRILSKIA